MPTVWHPRSNARPTSWTMSNGRWGTVFGRIDLVDVHRNMLWSSVYVATFVRPGVTRDLGEFESGDLASVALWEAFMASVPRNGQTTNRPTQPEGQVGHLQ